MFQVRCSLAAGEIKECCKRALQDFFDGNVTLDKTVVDLGWMAGPGKPILSSISKKASQCLKKDDGRIDSRKLKAVSRGVLEPDDHKMDERPDETTPVHVGGMVVAAGSDHQRQERPDVTTPADSRGNGVAAESMEVDDGGSVEDVEGSKAASETPVYG